MGFITHEEILSMITIAQRITGRGQKYTAVRLLHYM